MKKLSQLITLLLFSATLFAQAGELDPSFGDNGIVRTNLDPGYNAPFSGKQVIVQSDGSIFVLIEAVSGNYIQKRFSDGSLDASYGINGFLTLSNLYAIHMEVQDDGKIVVAGSFETYPFESISVLRYNTDGTPDASFNQPIISFGDLQVPISVNILSDGKIVILCQVQVSVADDFYQLGVVRLTANGQQEASANWYSVFGIPYAIQNDGNIIAAIGEGPAIIRFHQDGTVDPGFAFIPVLPFSISAVAIQSDGKIVAAGFNGHNYLSLTRFNADGTPDNSFSDDGLEITSLAYTPVSISFGSDEKIIVLASNGIIQFNSDGSIDNNFSGDGILAGAAFNSIAIQDNGKIIATGNTILARYNSDGAADNSFGGDGEISNSINIRTTYYHSAATQTDGKIVAAGYALIDNSYDFAIARYNTDGSLDPGFSDDGKQTTDFGFDNSYAKDVIIQTDGKILLGGYSLQNNISHFILARYNSDGSLDNTFSGDGRLITPDFDSWYNRHPFSILLQSDGKIVIAGSNSDRFGHWSYFIARFNTNGSADDTFNAAAVNSIFSGAINSIAIQPDGKIVLVGGKQYFEIIRLNTDGSLDNTFDDDGYQEVEIQSGDNDYETSVAEDLAIQSDGKIVIAGNWRLDYRISFSDFAMVRLNTDGSLDNSFSDDGKIQTSFDGGLSSSAATLAIQSDGKIVVGGKAIYRNNDSSFALVRYNTDGTQDDTFGNDGITITHAGGSAEGIQKIVISDNKLYAAGSSNISAEAGILARYLLDDNSSNPSITLFIPDSIVIYSAPARIKLNAVIANITGNITKVRFYSGTTQIHTEVDAPYGFLWADVPQGSYTLTAKAYDDQGNIITSNAIDVAVVSQNVAPVVYMTNPMHDTTYTGTSDIRLIARAKDPNGKISTVKFYNGNTLIRTENYYPYAYTWKNVAPGTYTITAVATDDEGLSTTSDAVTITVVSTNILTTQRSPGLSEKLGNELKLRLSPNPASDILNVYIEGNQNEPAVGYLYSASGTLIRTVRTLNTNQALLDVSSLSKGLYFIKIVSGHKVKYKQFIKL